MRYGFLLLHPYLVIMPEVLVRALRRKDETVPQVGKQEVKLTLSTENSSLFFKDPKDYIK